MRASRDSSANAIRQVDDAAPTALRRILGGQLRQLREAAGISRQEAAETLRASESKISRLELGRVGCRQRDLTDLLTLYGISDPAERDTFFALARRANASGWWQRDHDWLPPWFDTYLGLETAAARIRGYEQGAMPELLQTADYARAHIRLAQPDLPPAMIERRMQLRLRRQKILTREHPARLWVVVEEAALNRLIGGTAVWRDQVEHLLRMLERSNIEVQILSDAACGPAMTAGSFTMLRFTEPDLPDIVYTQQLTGAAYLDKDADLEAYRRLADRLAVYAIPPDRTAQFLTRLRDSRAPILDRPAGRSE
ncbi:MULTISPECIES: helix-turn-helix transcriptional regulator [unclassified Nocardia]|uniref:helix-turn-helix domain-containing protein n=1 Tax=unclassified Nocardia TaxID=2637762 RepID=UPI001CE3EAA7|nr:MULTISPECIES: helix-turn-helix transcriptional regulator [unclassified Nocardia]